MHQVARSAHIAGNTQFLHDVKLRPRVGGAGRNGGAAKIAQGFFKHETRRGKVVIEGHLHHVPGAEADGIERFGIPPVVIQPIFGIKNGTGRKKDALEFADILRQQTAKTGANGLKKNQFLLLENGNMLDVGNILELLHIELSAIKTLLHIFRIPVGIRQQILELDQAILAAFAFIKDFPTVVDAFGTVFTRHGCLRNC